MRRGQPRTLLLRETQAGPGGGPACVIWEGSSLAGRMPMFFPTPRPGTDGNHSCGFVSARRPEDGRLFLFVDDAAFHAAGDDDHLAGDMARELVGREDDDLACNVLRLGDLA
jgi:hypothetical protein